MQISALHRDQFAAQKYTYIRKLVREPDRAQLFRHAVERAKTATMTPDTRVPGTPAAYADPLMEELLERLTPSVEEATQLFLFPTYSYFRVYKSGDVLARHIDRPACEISVSVNLGQVSDAAWPIWIHGSSGPSRIEMDPGDAVIYRGIECAHWREAFSGVLAAQVFLHYVNKNGPLAEWRFDKRKRLGTVPEAAICICDDVVVGLHDQILELKSGAQLPLDSFGTFVWKKLTERHPARVIVEQAVKELATPECDAQVEFMKSINTWEKKGLLRL